MTAYKVDAGYLIGPGLRVEAASLLESERQSDYPAEGREVILDAIVLNRMSCFVDQLREVLDDLLRESQEVVVLAMKR